MIALTTVMLHVHVIYQLITLSYYNLRNITKTQGNLLGDLPISLLHFTLQATFAKTSAQTPEQRLLP